MSDKTFKQQVEEILHHCDREEKCGWPYCDSCDYRVDRILVAHNAELDRIAEEVPPCAFVYDADNVVKDYIQAQKGS